MTTDPQALRALAHPIRWKLIDLLDREDSATATRCAQALGESVASCAYHLGILAKYGYVEAVPERTGREKPWRLTARRQVLDGSGSRDGRLAAQAATEAFLEHEFARLQHRLRRAEGESPEWREAACLVGSSMWVTEDELAAIKQQFLEIAQRYGDRDADPSLRPAGARRARVFATSGADPDDADSGEGNGAAPDDQDSASADLVEGTARDGDPRSAARKGGVS